MLHVLCARTQVAADMLAVNERRRSLLAKQRNERCRAWRDYVEGKSESRQRLIERAESKKAQAWQQYVRTLLPLQPAVSPGGLGGSAYGGSAYGGSAYGGSAYGSSGGLLGAASVSHTTLGRDGTKDLLLEGGAAPARESRQLLEDVRHMLASPSQLIAEGLPEEAEEAEPSAYAQQHGHGPRAALSRPRSSLPRASTQPGRRGLGRPASGFHHRSPTMLRPDSGGSLQHGRGRGHGMLRRPQSAAVLPSGLPAVRR
jgi:hypothetical protein